MIKQFKIRIPIRIGKFGFTFYSVSWYVAYVKLSPIEKAKRTLLRMSCTDREKFRERLLKDVEQLPK